MSRVECPGLPADWLNAWLASIGLLALEPRLRLSWTRGSSPIAVLTCEGDEDPLSLAASCWPQKIRLDAMPIANQIEGRPDMGREVSLEVFRSRAEYAREHADSWTLSSTVTDLFVDVGSDRTVRRAQLYATGPGSIRWLHYRLNKIYVAVEDPSEMVKASLRGHGTRVKDNGLGFDATRIAGLADDVIKLVDPVIEVFSFFGLRLLPMRGDGVEVGKSGTRNRFSARQRCWSLDRNRTPHALHMTWPAWEQPLDLSGVDALLDLWSDLNERNARGGRVPRAARSRLGIHSAWRTVRYDQRGSADNTVGLTAARVELDARRR